jgi:hypothetical protein
LWVVCGREPIMDSETSTAGSNASVSPQTALVAASQLPQQQQQQPSSKTQRVGSASFRHRQILAEKASMYLAATAKLLPPPPTSTETGDLRSSPACWRPPLGPVQRTELALLSLRSDTTDLSPVVEALARNRHVSKLVLESCIGVTDAFVKELADCAVAGDQAAPIIQHAAGRSSPEPFNATAGISELTLISCNSVTDHACEALRRWVLNPSASLRRVIVRGPVCPFSRAAYEALQAASATKMHRAVWL